MPKKFWFLSKDLMEQSTQSTRGCFLYVVIILEEEIASSPRLCSLQLFVNEEFR